MRTVFEFGRNLWRPVARPAVPSQESASPHYLGDLAHGSSGRRSRGQRRTGGASLGSDRELSPGRCASARVAGGHDPARRSGSETPLTARRGPADRCGHLDRGGRLTPAGARGAQRDVDRGGGRALPARGGARARLDGEVPEVGKAPGEPQPGSLRAPAQVIGTADLDRRAIVQGDVGVVSAPRGSHRPPRSPSPEAETDPRKRPKP
jgi:hypothetical protein